MSFFLSNLRYQNNVQVRIIFCSHHYQIRGISLHLRNQHSLLFIILLVILINIINYFSYQRGCPYFKEIKLYLNDKNKRIYIDFENLFSEFYINIIKIGIKTSKKKSFTFFPKILINIL